MWQVSDSRSSRAAFHEEPEMEGEKEKQQEEKECNEAEDDRQSNDDADNEDEEDLEEAALVWEEGYEDNLGLPIMHWEALNLHIAELEKQEEQKKAKSGVSLERGRPPVCWTEERKKRAGSWEDGNDICSSHLMALSSRLQTQMNLQLCFINNSESEEDEKKEEINKKENSSTWRGAVQVHKNSEPAAKSEKLKTGGLRNTLRNLRDRLRTDQKTVNEKKSDPVVQRRHQRSDLQSSGIKELNALCTSLSQKIQDLSSELVGRLQVRDQLRTEQDAMLLEVQDLTSL